MDTHSIIAYQDPTTKEYRSIYCHWNGNVSFSGRILEKVYGNLELVKKLISKGDISTLYNLHESNGMVRAPLHYHTWRKDDWDKVKPLVVSDLKSLFEIAYDSYAEHLYVFIDGEWMYSENVGDANSANKLKPLSDTMENIALMQSLTNGVVCTDGRAQFSDDSVNPTKEAVNAFYSMPSVATPAVSDTKSDSIICKSVFIGSVFGYETNTQWVSNTVEWLDNRVSLDNNHPLRKLSRLGYHALMRDIAKALDCIDLWGGVYNLGIIDAGLRDSLDNLNFDDKSTLVITVEGYKIAFDDINKKLADGAYPVN